MNTRDDIFAAINTERARQDKKWGGCSNDDRHSKESWFHFIYNQIQYFRGSRISFRGRLIRVEALCIAAIESDIRREHILDALAKKEDMAEQILKIGEKL